MKTLSTELNTAIRRDTTFLCRLIEITRIDGEILRLTDAVMNVVIGDDVYRADVGFTLSSLMLGINLQSSQGLTLTVAMTDGGISKSDLRARKYYAATVETFLCDFTQPEDTKQSLWIGKVGRVSFTETGVATIETVPYGSSLEQFADESYSQTCRASLGDELCQFPIEAYRVDFTVTRVIDNSQFVVDTFGSTAAATPLTNYFGFGQMKWLSGSNLNWEMDIIQGTFSTKTITLFYPTPETMQVGDTGKMYPGCNRQHSTCSTKFSNTLNYRGEPYAPQWTLA